MKTEYIWTTAERKRIVIKDMTDTHLINTVRYLRRIGLEWQLNNIADAYGAASSFDSESMASYYADQQCSYLETENLEDFLLRTVPQYKYMLDQLKKRGIEI